MHWALRWWILLAAGLPAFIGYPEGIWPGLALQGVSPARLTHGIAIYVLIGVCCGGGFLAGAVSAASMILLPLVVAGAGLSYSFHLTGLAYPGGPADYSPHYVALVINMLVVIPLALSLVLTIPFSRFETRLLRRHDGVTRREKYTLMMLRVFNHIAFSVIPAALEVVREERWGDLGRRFRRRSRGEAAASHRMGSTVAGLVHLASTCICSALCFVPLWALEIAGLPERARQRQKADHDDRNAA